MNKILPLIIISLFLSSCGDFLTGADNPGPDALQVTPKKTDYQYAATNPAKLQYEDFTVYTLTDGVTKEIHSQQVAVTCAGTRFEPEQMSEGCPLKYTGSYRITLEYQGKTADYIATVYGENNSGGGGGDGFGIIIIPHYPWED